MAIRGESAQFACHRFALGGQRTHLGVAEWSRRRPRGRAQRIKIQADGAGGRSWAGVPLSHLSARQKAARPMGGARRGAHL